MSLILFFENVKDFKNGRYTFWRILISLILLQDKSISVIWFNLKLFNINKKSLLFIYFFYKAKFLVLKSKSNTYLKYSDIVSLLFLSIIFRKSFLYDILLHCLYFKYYCNYYFTFHKDW